MKQGSSPPDRREIQQKLSDAEAEWFAYMCELSKTDPIIRAQREAFTLGMHVRREALGRGEPHDVALQAALDASGLDELKFDATTRVAELKREFFAHRGFTLRPAKPLPAAPASDEWPESANVGEPWRDKQGRLRQPAVMYQADDGNVTYGHEAIVASSLDYADHGRRRASSRVQANGKRPRNRASHANGRGHRTTRSSALSGDSGDEGGESEPEPRQCACGCGRDISHKRVGALTYDASCRQRFKRQQDTDVDALLDDVKEDQRSAWADAGREGIGTTGLTAEFEDERGELAQERRVARSRRSTPRRAEMDALAVTRWMMESNGVSTSGLTRRSPWQPSRTGGLRTRPEMVA